MTRSELVTLISQRFPQFQKADAIIAVDEILGAIGSALTAGRRVEIRGFGSFSVTYRRPRQARNPKTGERIRVPGKYVPKFTPGLALFSLPSRK